MSDKTELAVGTWCKPRNEREQMAILNMVLAVSTGTSAELRHGTISSDEFFISYLKPPSTRVDPIPVSEFLGAIWDEVEKGDIVRYRKEDPPQP